MKQRDLFGLIRSFVGQANILTIPRIFIQLTGTLESALLLSQILYWSDKTADGWIYKTYKDWEEELGIKEGVIRRSMIILKRLELVEIKLKKANGAPTLHYKVSRDFSDKLLNWLNVSDPILSKRQNGFCQNDRMDSAKMTESLTEITTEIIFTDEPKQKLYNIAVALSEVTGLNYEVNKPRLYKTAKDLALVNNLTADIIYRDYGKDGSWYKSDWRGQKGQKPNLSSIKETIMTYDQTSTANGTKVINGSVKGR